MKHLALSACCFLLSAAAAWATPSSTVDPTYPATTDDIDASGLRGQFQATASDINELYGLVSGTLSLQPFTLTGDVLASGTGSASASVVAIKGATLGSTTPTAGSLLIGSGSAWSSRPLTGDCSLTSAGAITCPYISGTPFAPSATVDTTNAENISSGTLPAARIATDLFGSTAPGVVPASGGGTTNFLRADGAWVPPASASFNPIVYPESYGAVGNAHTYFDGAMNGSNVLTSASASFTSGVVGDLVCVANVAGSSHQLCGTITGYTSSTSVTTSFSATGSYSGLQFAFGASDNTAFSNMLSTAPCSTTGCSIQLAAKHYALSIPLVLPANIPINLTGSGAGVPNTANNYINGNALTNNSDGTWLQFLTKGLTSAGLSAKGTPGVTNTTANDVVQHLAVVGGVGVGSDGGGADGFDILNWQNVKVSDVIVYNFAGKGFYIDSLVSSSYSDYIEGISLDLVYPTFNGSAGIQIGSASINCPNLENIAVTNSTIEGNLGPGILAAGVGIQGLVISNNTIQWDNRSSANPQILVTGDVIGGLATANYFEIDTNLSSQSTGPWSLTAGAAGIRKVSNFYNPSSAWSSPAYSAAGVALPSCTSGFNSHTAWVTTTVSDATACTIGSTYTSGGSTRCDVTCNGTNWIESGSASYN